MKFYESNFEEYIQSLDKIQIHPELKEIHEKFPRDIQQMRNLIIYGPSGVGKYSQVLKLIQRYSPSGLKHTKHIKLHKDKLTYTYNVSDIHYEVDMALLGCTSKVLWHEVFSQITDIITIKQDKTGIIVCKNFQSIHTELLEIFYSYMQTSSLIIRFILITEHISFIPNTILQCSKCISIRRPEKAFYKSIAKTANCQWIEPKDVLNLKEIRSFGYIVDERNIPKDIFNIICNNIIENIENYTKFGFIQFRDCIYDILIYNLDATECLWYILIHFIKHDILTPNSTHEILQKTYSFLKYYNNNYLPIYHLERIFYYIVERIIKKV